MTRLNNTLDTMLAVNLWLDHTDEGEDAVKFRKLISSCKTLNLEQIKESATLDNVNEKDKNGNTPLHILASTPGDNQAECIQYLQSLKADSLKANVVGRTSLQLACIHNNLPIIKLLATPENIHHKDNGANTLLHFACLADSDAFELVTFLLELGCDPDETNNSDMIPLHNAIYTNQFETVKLLTTKENVHFPDSHGNTSLHLSISSRHPESHKIARFLLDFGADPLALNNQGRTPLYTAAQHNQLENVKVLASPDNVNIQDSRGKTVLHHTFNFPSPDQDMTPIVKHLLSLGADIMIKNGNNERPLHVACTSNNLSSIRLLACEEIVNEGSNHGNRPLHLACLYDANAGDAMKVVRFLIAQGANPFLLNDDDKLPLHFACLSNQYNIINLLMSVENIDPLCKYGNTPLHYAVSSDHDVNKAIRLLVNNGANPTLKNTFGMSPLDIAAHRGHLQHFMSLAGPLNINYQDENLNTPLHYALGSDSDCTEIIKYALSVGADVLMSNRAGLTPLHMSCHSCNPEYVKLVVTRQNVNFADSAGNSPLMCAVIGGMVREASECIRLILALDGNPLQTNKCGETPLHYACYKSKLSYIKLMLDEDTINAPDKDGFTPLLYSYLAAEPEAQQVAEYLLSKGAIHPRMTYLDIDTFKGEIPPRLYGDTFNPTKYAATRRLHDQEIFDAIPSYGQHDHDSDEAKSNGIRSRTGSISSVEANAGSDPSVGSPKQDGLGDPTENHSSKNPTDIETDTKPVNQPLESLSEQALAAQTAIESFTSEDDEQ